jgi:hypothetical protein
MFTVNDRISPWGLICQNQLYGWGLIRDGGLLIYVTFLCAKNKKCSYKEQDIRKYFIQQVAGEEKKSSKF